MIKVYPVSVLCLHFGVLALPIPAAFKTHYPTPALSNLQFELKAGLAPHKAWGYSRLTNIPVSLSSTNHISICCNSASMYVSLSS